jgi:phosphoglycerate dehydrogenase-like enzyme
MAIFKVAVTDSVFPNLDTELAILAREGAELAASQCRSVADAAFSVPDSCIAEVSDHAVAMTLSLLRKLPLSDRRVRAGDWDLKPIAPLNRLSTPAVSDLPPPRP